MTIRAVVLGGSGYVGGELLRLLRSHPAFELAAAVSRSFAGRPIGEVFPHLDSTGDAATFVAPADWSRDIPDHSRLAVFSAAPHGASAGAIAGLLGQAREKHLDVHVVDASADFRFDSATTYGEIYGIEHAAPELLPAFTCAVPEHATGVASGHVGHPGCFATAALLASVPLVRAGLVDDDIFLAGITGSTGSGRNAKPGTHHPERHGNVYAYNPLAHRHAPEIAFHIERASGNAVRVHFVPHSGPFARGIHMTLQARLRTPRSADEIRSVFSSCYADSPFVSIVNDPPRLKDVVAGNQSRIGVAEKDGVVTVLCVIDNLLKGAAGGAMQWMNRLWSLPEAAGLEAAPPAWT